MRVLVAATCLAFSIHCPHLLQGSHQSKDDPIRLGLPARQSWYALVSFPANWKAEIDVKSAKEGDVDLWVLDACGAIVAKDVGVGKDAKVTFTMKEEQTLLIKITNLGPGDNECTLVYNGKAGITALPPLVKLAPGAKHAYFVQTVIGEVASLHGDFKKDVALAIYDVDGVKIAADPRGQFVAWSNRRPGIVRAVLVNTGKEEASAKVVLGADNLVSKALTVFDLDHDAKKSFELRFPAETIAAVWVSSEKDTDVDLMIYDKAGKEVISDITLGKDCFVGWRPGTEQTYRVVVLNHGVGGNRCVLKHTGKLVK